MKTFITTALIFLLAALAPATACPVSSSTTSSLETRAGPLQSRYITGMNYCGNFPNAHGTTAKSLLNKMKNKLKEHEFTIAALGCDRVSCWDTSAIYVCNDNDYELTVTGQQIYDVGQYIKSCCKYTSAGKTNDGSIVNGQQFTQWGWNVVMAYGNCKASSNQRPADAGGSGVNAGDCRASSGMVLTG